jgi:kanamycin kinase
VTQSPAASRCAPWRQRRRRSVDRRSGEGGGGHRRRVRALHDALPVASCPFSWSVADRLADIGRRAAAGAVRSDRWHRITPPTISSERSPRSRIPRRSTGWWSVMATPALPTRSSTPVAASPGMSISARSESPIAGPISRSRRGARAGNYGSGWEDGVLEAYGIARDEERTRYYRLLWGSRAVTHS